MHSLWQDFRYGFRGIRKQPSFACLAILALALGIGSATTIFSAIYNILLDPFPYTDAKRVIAVQIHDTTSSRPGGRTGYQTAEFIDYKEQVDVFEDVIGGGFTDVLYNNGEGTEQFNGGLVTGNTFQFLGVPAQIGRAIVPEDTKPGAPPVFVMSHKMWGKNFSFDASVIGRTFVLNGVPTTLVGVMPMRFTKLGSDLWLPVRIDRGDPQMAQQYFMLQGRLKRGVTVQQAQAAIDVVARRIALVYPRNYPKNFSVVAVPWIDNVVGSFRRTLYTLGAAVALLLLIACANVANMLLARASAREKEMAVRSSLGASRWRLVRQLLIESLLLAVGGTVLGCLFAYGGLKALVAIMPVGMIPREAVITLNFPVLAFSLAVAALTAILFGLAPALQTVKKNLVEPLKDAGKGVSGGFRKGKLRNALVVAEVALSLLLLVGAGLLMRSFVALQQVDLGFNPDNILVTRVPLPRGQYKTTAAKQQFFRTALQRIQSLPGVTSATAMSSLPPYGGIRSEIDIPGKTHNERWDGIVQFVSEDYFKTLGVQLRRGRLLSEVEVSDSRKSVVVNQTFVSRYFGNEDPLGRPVRLKLLETLPEDPVQNAVFEIVGVVSDAKNQGVQEAVIPEMFVPYGIVGAFERGFMLRTAGDPLAMVNSLRREIWAVDRSVAVTFTDSLSNFLKSFTYAAPRFTFILLSVFACTGLILVALGVYSVIAYTVSRQTHEIGIRMALGAARSDVMRMVLRMGMTLVAIGVGAGLFLSLAATRMISAEVWGISPRDPATLAGVIAVVAAAGLCACYFPARRATRVDPMISLRYE